MLARRLSLRYVTGLTAADDNGVWLATSHEHHEEPARRVPKHALNWSFGQSRIRVGRFLPAAASDFESAALRACELVSGARSAHRQSSEVTSKESEEGCYHALMMKRLWPVLLLVNTAFAQQPDLLKDLQFPPDRTVSRWTLHCRDRRHVRSENFLLRFSRRWCLENHRCGAFMGAHLRRPIQDILRGAIAVSESDPSMLYVGMGESCVRGNASNGDGVYKSLDGGRLGRTSGCSRLITLARW